ncbi:hypothetical protein QFZ81_002968 [Paenibacillus sp. V4I9]|uniref:hypothetical protein n=1 Tax=Paenibacillus sp. V4I9 TaxID=3042308 RepID=UPI002785B99F|nr:hypothetical protein [Paenibacillus sp. V4I9]MDQ0887880.1 hypothetical protein [Paenibacillus sp. V4I9]
MRLFKGLTVTICILFAISFLYYCVRKDAMALAVKSYDYQYVAKSTEIVWFNLTPYWSVTMQKEGKNRTIMIDPILREVIAE